MSNIKSPTAFILGAGAAIIGEIAQRAAIAQAIAKRDTHKGEKSMSTRFEVSGDTVLDTTTGLMWSRGNVPGGRMNWAKAKEACAALSLGGFSDWRLPTITELLALVDYDRHEPAINTDVFACESSWYWTSTPAHRSPGDYAWIVDFDGGFSGWGSQGYDYYVRAVRASQ